MAAGISSVSAELESLEEKPWYGYFAGYQGKKADFGLDTDGEAIIIPLKKDAKGKDAERQMTTQYYLKLAYQVEETLPDGKTVVKKFDVDSIESASKPTAKPGNIMFKGKLDGSDATFEGYFEVSRGMVLVGGRVVDKGTITNPLKFSVKIVVPSAYKNAKKDDEKAFKKRLAEDKIEVKLLDGKKAKADAFIPFEPKAPEFSGTGVNQVEFSVDELGGSAYTFTASPGSKIALSNTNGQPFYDGLTIYWESDPTADASKTRLAIDVK